MLLDAELREFQINNTCHQILKWLNKRTLQIKLNSGGTTKLISKTNYFIDTELFELDITDDKELFHTALEILAKDKCIDVLREFGDIYRAKLLPEGKHA